MSEFEGSHMGMDPSARVEAYAMQYLQLMLVCPTRIDH